MEENFKLRGKAIRMGRLLKDTSIQEFAELTGISANYIAMMEREECSISVRNHIRFVRTLRKELKLTEAQIVALQLFVEHEEMEKEVK